MNTSRWITLGVAAAMLCLRSVDGRCKASDGEPSMRYSGISNRLYVEGGCASMADLVAFRTEDTGILIGPIYHFDPASNSIMSNYTGKYYLESGIHVINGSTLSIDGRDSETEPCKTLYIRSDSDNVLNIRAHGGNIDIRNTKIFSWDIGAGTYDTTPEDGRSHLSAITEKITGRYKDTCPDDTIEDEGYSKGNAKKDMGNANMDITWSEIAYLGYAASESYGISYKARGLCKDQTNLDIYDDDNGLNVGVTGNIVNSILHHNWFGQYTWGHDAGRLVNNKVFDNHGYGFDPHDDSDNMTIIGNEVYNNGWHGIITSKRCNNAIIKNNEVYNNGENGIMLHRSCDYATVSGNVVYDNGDSGLALYESSYAEVYGNTFTNNLGGVRCSNGANSNNVYHNEIRIKESSGETSGYALYMYKGYDEPEADNNPDGHPRYNMVQENDIYSEQDEAWKITNADDNVFQNNTIHSGSYATFRAATDNVVRMNTFPGDFYFNVDDESCFRNNDQAEPQC